MLKVLGCFTDQHDFTLVVLAAAICAIASFATIKLLAHARAQRPGGRVAWLAVAAVASGSGIWATHFIAMLAYAPGVPNGYDLGLTGISLALAVVTTGVGLALATIGRLASLGGAAVGVGVAVMHFTGMAAFEVAGHLAWDATLVAAAILLGAFLGGAALTIAVAGVALRRQAGAAGLLLLAICGLHFTAMGAVTITPDPLVAVSPHAVPTSWLAVAVALASAMILVLACAALALDIRERRNAGLERDRMRSLANAAVEGLVICRDGIIVNANENFAKLAGVATAELTGQPLSRHLGADVVRHAQDESDGRSVEAELLQIGGATIPVEIVVRSIDVDARPHYAVAVRDLTARLKAEKDIHFLAHHDPLTGVPNRTNFNERLDQAINAARAGGGKLAVLCIDLDRFKEVNDLFGHAAGDALLQSVAGVLSEMIGLSHTVARLGGDEFAVMAPVEHARAAGRLAERIIARLSTLGADTAGPVAAASVGIALFPDDCDDRDALLGKADIALYRAKSEGRGGYRFFEAAMGAEIHNRRMMEHDLRSAISRNELEVLYQPQSLISSGAIVGFEALARWTHPQRGAVSPSVFIPLAEETGSILQIGEWVLRTACSEAATWSNTLAIAVNVSAVQLHSPQFPEQLRSILAETGLAPHRLELEITETALIRDLPRAVATLMRIKVLGVRIAMDDFGTGYSSLSNLRAFPFDKIKIDRSFIKSVDHNEQTAAIVRSVLGLGRGLGLPVLAEGVETEAEMRFLEAENCHGAQGYLLGKPAHIASFSALTGGPSKRAEDAAVRAA